MQVFQGLHDSGLQHERKSENINMCSGSGGHHALHRQKMTACQHQCQRCSMSAAAGDADLARHSAASAEDETWTTVEVCASPQ